MSDSDDDMPPPLEDMSEQLAQKQEKIKQFNAALGHVAADEGEEVRLGGSQPKTAEYVP